jgi:hypothetical protein
MIKAACTSETSVDNYFTRQYIPEDKSELHTRRRENLKSHIYRVILEVWSILWEVTVSAIVSKTFTYICHILNCYRDIDIEIKIQVNNINILNVKNKWRQVAAKLVMCQHIINL